MKLFTYGYSGRRAQGLVSTLLTFGAPLLVDVRMSPRARVPEWSGAALGRAFGPMYVHIPQFGNLNYKNDGPVQLADPVGGVRALQQATLGLVHLPDEPTVVLLCACRVRAGCHREDVAAAILKAIPGTDDAGELFNAGRGTEPTTLELFPPPPRV